MGEAGGLGLLLVLGMHRSGTSCLAGMLESAGFASGAGADFNAHNRRGNREDPAVVAFNDRVLAAWGGAWHRPPAVTGMVDEPTVHEALRHLVEAGTETQAPRAVKDPRLLLTLPLWRAAFPQARRIGIFRHPMRTAQSLYYRAHGQQPLARGLQLWTVYNECLLAEHERRPFPLLCFDLPSAEFVDAVARALEDECADLVAAGRLTPGQAGAFHDPAERHQQAVIGVEALQDDPEAVAALDPALALYRRLCERAGIVPPAMPEGQPELDREYRDLREADGAREAGDADRAEALYRTLAARSRHPAALWWRWVEWSRAWTDPQARVRTCREAVAALPDDPGLGLELALALRAAGQPEAALEALDRVLDRRPGWRDALLARGSVLQALGRPAEAVESFDAARVTDAASPWHLVPYAVALRLCGRADAAAQAFRLALERNPPQAHPVARQQWAQALAASGDLAAARREFEAALAGAGTHEPMVRAAYARLLRRHRLAAEADRIEAAS